MGKVQPIIDSIRQTCLESYKPSRDNAIDEAMIKYKGRSTLKQYAPDKPIKRGIKVWVRADSHNEYVCDFSVYKGKDGEQAVTNLGGKVVTNLSRPLVGGNYHLYFDNFFSSPKLYLQLLDDNIIYYMLAEHIGRTERVCLMK